MQTKLYYPNRLPFESSWRENAFLIYDKSLSRRSPEFNVWQRKMPGRLAVTAGESLKSVDCFGRHIKPLLEKTRNIPRQDQVLIVAGGGSVGDFGGFCASVLRRGVELIHFPTTWLAAMDSAHGGKNALNVGGFKNQVGTFYPAQSVYMVKSVLTEQPQTRVKDALGELAKIALLDSDRWFESMVDCPLSNTAKLWKFLPRAVQSKYKIVKSDPEEKLGHRQLLNFGHTLGHALESHFRWPHGRAVGQGLHFAIDWSYYKGILAKKEWIRSQKFLNEQMQLPSELNKRGFKPLSVLRLKNYLQFDKKRSGNNNLSFVFLKRPGVALQQKVRIQDVLSEACRQGWAK